MSNWYENTNIINCSLQDIIKSVETIGEHYVGVVSLMPGLTNVELLEDASNNVTIKTNEGIMKRNNISVLTKGETLTIEYDEEYKAGKFINVKSHVVDEFTSNGNEVSHQLVISDVNAAGIIGLMYKLFGKKSIGNSLLGSYKKFFE